MVEVTLSEYTGYIYLEMIKAREMADSYSRAVAERYENDPVLKHFPTPRFKIPKINLTIPMLVAGARFSQIERFNMELEKFEALVVDRLDKALTAISATPPDRAGAAGSSRRKAGGRTRRPDSGIDRAGFPASVNLLQMVKGFHAELSGAGTAAPPIKESWAMIFQTALAENNLVEAYKKRYRNNQLFDTTLIEVSRIIKEHTTISGVKIQSLLINPETSMVRNGATDATVFTVQAEMSEDGFFLRTVRDSESGGESKIVEFD